MNTHKTKQRAILVRDAFFFEVVLRTKNYTSEVTTSGARFRPVLPGMSLLSLEPPFRLISSGFSLAAFDRLRGTRVVASYLYRTWKSEENGVACCSSNILGKLVASTSRKPSTFTFCLDKSL